MKNWLISGMLLIGGAAVQSASAQAITFGLSGEPISLDPSVTADGNSAYVQTQIYNSLISFKPGTVDLQPELALRWTTSNDGLTWTFYLRQNIKFQDGTPLNAEAVRFNFMRWWDPSFGYGGGQGLSGLVEQSGWLQGRGRLYRQGRAGQEQLRRGHGAERSVPGARRGAGRCGAVRHRQPDGHQEESGAVRYSGGTAVGTGPFMLEQVEQRRQCAVQQES